MKAEEQLVAIAEFCGWKTVCTIGGIFAFQNPNGGLHPSLPDYLNDLNAMRDAAEFLFASRPRYYERSYVSALQEVLGHDSDSGMMDNRSACALLHATAAQRAEALLKTIGKWKDS
jgi:hypothetical protein